MRISKTRLIAQLRSVHSALGVTPSRAEQALTPRRTRRTGAIRRRVTYIVLSVACVIPVALAVAAAPASAYERINEHCILRAYEPVADGYGDFSYTGEVDCREYKSVWMEIEVCAEVQNTESGKFYKISETCKAGGPFFTAFVEEGGVHTGNCGVNYRTWDRGKVWHGSSGKREGEWGSKEYRSSPITNYCG